MTRPTARVLALLEILQAGGTRTAAELADRLGVDERTVRRYVDHLLDLDVPVRAERGRYGGYHVASGYRMPPLMLTDDEALAVLFGLVAGQRAGLVATSAPSAEAAAAKVRRVLPEALRRRLDALLATADFTASARAATPPETVVLLTLAEAARDRRPVDIDYIDREGHRSKRTVHPYGIVAHSGRWYVTGEDSIRRDVRTFRLDRIEIATTLPGSFEVPEDFDPIDRLLTGLAEAPYRHEVSLRVQGTLEQVRARLPAALATVREIPTEPPPTPGATTVDEWVRVRMRAERLDWIPALLASLGRPFVIEHPDALRDEVRDFARRLAAYADAISGDDPTGS
jgi:predicted DNA-binding transcriptional regulator YafY